MPCIYKWPQLKMVTVLDITAISFTNKSIFFFVDLLQIRQTVVTARVVLHGSCDSEMSAALPPGQQAKINTDCDWVAHEEEKWHFVSAARVSLNSLFIYICRQTETRVTPLSSLYELNVFLLFFIWANECLQPFALSLSDTRYLLSDSCTLSAAFVVEPLDVLCDAYSQRSRRSKLILIYSTATFITSINQHCACGLSRTDYASDQTLHSRAIIMRILIEVQQEFTVK